MFYKIKDSRDFWNITGSFGEMWEQTEEKEGIYSAKNDKVQVLSQIKDYGDGVYVRTGCVKNISDQKISLNTFSSKFILNGGEYELYSQYSGWKNESTGEWQKLVTAVVARSVSVRSTSGAAPFMALWSNQANRGFVFHLLAESAWEMRIARVYREGQASAIEVELGVLKDGLSLELMPGEEIALPEIIFYQAYNKTDLDCWRLHGMLNREYPRKEMPVVYNTWLYKFDQFTYDDVLNQVKKAQELGAEYFVIDAGWFGEGKEWWGSRGDWKENMTIGFKGRMTEMAEIVRGHDMKFGFWLEPECASEDAHIVKEHPEYFLKGDGSMFLDFANPDALDYIVKTTCKFIDRYGAKYVKFDFNADMKSDLSHSAFIKYFEGNREFIKRLREKYPDLYIENCASGGTRMCIRDGKLYDSFWISDNQSPYFGIEMFKNTILRMPPQWVECWATITSVKDLAPKYSDGGYVDKIIACNDATWHDVSGVHQSFLNGFLTGSPIGISCDLTTLSEEVFSNLRDFIEKFKESRSFWKNAVCHILTDTESMQVLEFRNEDFSRIELVVFSKKMMQNGVCVYPVLDGNTTYEVDGMEERTGKKIFEEGIEIPVSSCYMGHFMTILKK